MVLPENFSPFEHLQDTLRKIHNRRVREFFRDLADPTDNWDAEIDTPRGALRTACTMEDTDTGDMMNARMIVFQIVLEEAQSLQTPIYGIPSESYQESVKFAPQCTLFFQEDLQDTDPEYTPLRAELSFRLMGETSETITETKARALGQRIKQEFGTSGGYRWHKGRTKLFYRNPSEGFNFSIYAYNENEGINLLNKVLDLRSASLDRSKLSISTLAQNPPTVPPTEMIMGTRRRLPRQRAVGYVRFRYADLHVWGVPHAFTLYDRTGRRRNPLVEA